MNFNSQLGLTPDAHHQEGVRLAAAGQLAGALRHFDAAVRMEPQNPVWHYNRGLALQKAGQLENAVASYQSSIHLAPDFFEAWCNLCAALKGLGKCEEAVAAGRKAMALQPRSSSASLNLGNALKAGGDYQGAEAMYRLACALDPANSRCAINLANTLREAGRLSEAIPLLRETVRLHPRCAEAHRDLAFALMLSGDLAGGWIENEWRWQTEELAAKARPFPQPAWRGEDLRGRSVLAFSEQGYGDAIQFARYVPLLAERGAQVILECQPALKRLFSTLPGVTKLVVRGEPLPAFDFQVPLLSLPLGFGTRLESIPNRVPYLQASAESKQALAPAMGSVDRVSRGARRLPPLKAGLVWSGNPAHVNDRNRSIPAAMFQPLLNQPDVQFFSLQILERPIEWNGVDPSSRPVDLSRHLTDFASTAAALALLDLIISVDTSVAHLAGALGKPAWVLLPFAPDWRWLLDRTDSPWYPTLRLFRQAQPAQWGPVIERVGCALKEHVESSWVPRVRI